LQQQQQQTNHVYEGILSGKPLGETTKQLFQFQEKRRQYLDETVKLRREKILLKTRLLLLDAQTKTSKQDDYIEEVKEDVFNEETQPKSDLEGLDSTHPLYEELRRMEEENEENESNQKKNKRKGNKRFYGPKCLRSLALELSIPEWMVIPPTNLNGDYWFVYAKPDGNRCFLISTGGLTTRRDKNGFFESTFYSQLPGGCPGLDSRKTSILECIFNKELNIYFIMDVIIWKDISMAPNSTESRFFFIQENILSDPKLQEISEENEFIFATPKKYDCSEEGFKTIYRENTPFMKDGFLFAQKEAEYFSGSNPFLLIWKDVFTSLYAIETNGSNSFSLIFNKNNF